MFRSIILIRTQKHKTLNIRLRVVVVFILRPICIYTCVLMYVLCALFRTPISARHGESIFLSKMNFVNFPSVPFLSHEEPNRFSAFRLGRISMTCHTRLKCHCGNSDWNQWRCHYSLVVEVRSYPLEIWDTSKRRSFSSARPKWRYSLLHSVIMVIITVSGHRCSCIIECADISAYVLFS